MAPPKVHIAHRLIDKVKPTPQGCWEWQGTIGHNGYGRVRIGDTEEETRAMRFAHRVSYELYVKPIPDGKEIDHICRNRRCCNPAHLRVVTHQENAVLREEAKLHDREGPLVAEVLLALGTRRDLKVWRNNTGMLPDPRTGRWISFGLKGSADILGIRRVQLPAPYGAVGQFIAFECKSATGRLRPDQDRFRLMVESMGGVYVVVRSVADAINAVEGSNGVNGRGCEAGVQSGPAAGHRGARGPARPARKNGVPG